MRQGTITLEPAESSAGVARRYVRGLGSQWELDGEVVELAELLTSELVTNGVIHARTAMTLGVVANTVLRVSVRDANPRTPTVTLLPPDTASGRGLALVQTLAANWGVNADETGKQVWFELDL